MQQLQWIATLFRAWILLSCGFLQGNETPYKDHLMKEGFVQGQLGDDTAVFFSSGNENLKWSS